MERENDDSIGELRHELEILESRPELSDKEAEERFILWYEDICKERMAMLNVEEDYKRKIEELETAEEGYRSRIRELENSTVALVKTFEESQLEIKGLRNKYEGHGSNNDAYNEPYDIVSKERNILRERNIRNEEKIKKIKDEVTELKKYVDNKENKSSEKSKDKRYKERIKTLEDEVKMLRHYVKDINYLHDVKTDNVGKLVVITSTERLKSVESENEKLKYVLDKLKKKNRSLVSKAEWLETKLQSTEPVSAKRSTHVKTNTADTETIVINKKCIPSFLPRIRNSSPDLTADKRRSEFISTFSKQQDIPFLRFGLGYGEIYKRMLKRQPSKDKGSKSLSSSRLESITKYMI